jgi:hypothetical protein
MRKLSELNVGTAALGCPPGAARMLLLEAPIGGQ